MMTNNKIKYCLSSFLLFLCFINDAQGIYAKTDTLRGSLNSRRSCYDVVSYDLYLRINPKDSSILGSNTIRFNVINPFQEIQIDLFENMFIDSIVYRGQNLSYKRMFNAVIITFYRIIKARGEFKIYYHGKPLIAKHPPWDGGFSWKKDKNGEDWIGVACEGKGASLWWPNKDHPADEPDSMRISCSVPKHLVAVSNGRLKSIVDEPNDYKKYNWKVSYPINNYNVSVSIADYKHFSDIHINNGDTLDLDYYVLSYNLEKAKRHFKQTDSILHCLETFFGAYPFPRDGYKLVETSYVGMEHQSGIAYGNKYRSGYLGFSALNLDFDYIIMHETAHEWWGNSLTAYDMAELWIHEAFATYAESLFVRCKYGEETAMKYLASQKTRIYNKKPLIGPSEVNYDIYYKGAWILHTLRNVIDNDSLWFATIKGLANKFKISIVSTRDIVSFFEHKTGLDLQYFFNQYLYQVDIPVFEYVLKTKKKKMELKYRWGQVNEDFVMPIKVTINEKTVILKPSIDWQTLILEDITFKKIFVHSDLFYVKKKMLQKVK